jgi:hypothetical protein
MAWHFQDHPSSVVKRQQHDACLRETLIGRRYRAPPIDRVSTDGNSSLPLQRQMASRAHPAVSEARGGHAIYVSQPHTVITLIEHAAKNS